MMRRGSRVVENFYMRSITLETLEGLSRPEEFKKEEWNWFLRESKSYIHSGRPGRIMDVYSKEDLQILSSFFQSIPEEKCHQVLIKSPIKRQEVSKVLFILAKGKAHFGRSAFSLKSSLQKTDRLNLLKQKTFDLFQIQEVSLEDLRAIKLPHCRYEWAWRGLVTSGSLGNWSGGAPECIREYILKYVHGDKIKTISYEDFVQDCKKERYERHGRKGLCFYFDPERQLYYMNRDFYALKSKLERDPKVGGIKKPIYYISESMLEGSRYRYLISDGSRPSGKKSCSYVSGLCKDKEKLIHDLLEHFKGHQIIHRLSPIQEDRDAEERLVIGESDNELMDTEPIMNSRVTGYTNASILEDDGQGKDFLFPTDPPLSPFLRPFINENTDPIMNSGVAGYTNASILEGDRQSEDFSFPTDPPLSPFSRPFINENTETLGNEWEDIMNLEPIDRGGDRPLFELPILSPTGMVPLWSLPQCTQLFYCA